jgi:hypothetical protein
MFEQYPQNTKKRLNWPNSYSSTGNKGNFTTLLRQDYTCCLYVAQQICLTHPDHPNLVTRYFLGALIRKSPV